MQNLVFLSRFGLRFLCNSALRRSFLTQSSPSVLEETVDVPVGSNGSVSLNIYSSTHPSTAPAPHPIHLYLPPGPLAVQWRSPSLYDRFRHEVAQSEKPCTLLVLKYRLEPPNHVFPTPVHDTLAGLDWIFQNLYQPKDQGISPQIGLQPQISIYGSFIGATLATMLALTEPKHIHSVNVVNPVVDWVSLDDQPFRDSSDGKELLGIRNKLFRRADNYFDPFASPVLFLRAPNRDVPSDAAESACEFDENWNAMEDERPLPSVKRRKALRHFPPAGSDLRVNGQWRVPLMRFWVTEREEGGQNIFRAQAEEMVRLLRRNYMVNYKGLVNDKESRARIDLKLVPDIKDVVLP